MEIWIEHATLIPMTERGHIIKNGNLHVKDGRIVRLGKGKKGKAGAKAKRIDALSELAEA